MTTTPAQGAIPADQSGPCDRCPDPSECGVCAQCALGLPAATPQPDDPPGVGPWQPVTPELAKLGAPWSKAVAFRIGTEPPASQPVNATSEPSRPDLLERLTYHALERDDLSLDEALDYLATGWKKVHGRTERQMVLQLVALMASAPVAAEAPQEAAQGQAMPVPWLAVSLAIEEYIAGYELRGDEGDYTPTENERFLITDAVHGILADDDCVAAIRAAITRPAQPTQAPAQVTTAMVEAACRAGHWRVTAESIKDVRAAITAAFALLPIQGSARA